MTEDQGTISSGSLLSQIAELTKNLPPREPGLLGFLRQTRLMGMDVYHIPQWSDFPLRSSERHRCGN